MKKINKVGIRRRYLFRTFTSTSFSKPTRKKFVNQKISSMSKFFFQRRRFKSISGENDELLKNRSLTDMSLLTFMTPEHSVKLSLGRRTLRLLFFVVVIQNILLCKTFKNSLAPGSFVYCIRCISHYYNRIHYC